MFRSLHMKLVLIMMLLIVSLMTVVGAFLMNSAVRFFINDFYTQVNEVTSRAEFTDDLTRATEEETDPVAMIDQVLDAYVGELGVDGRNRNYYILDGSTAAFLAGSDEDAGESLPVTNNISTALTGQVGDRSDAAADYMCNHIGDIFAASVVWKLSVTKGCASHNKISILKLVPHLRP